MLGSPFVAPEARTLVDGALDVLDTTADRWHTFVLGGIRADTLGQAFDDLERALSRSYSLRRISPQERRVASLDGGLDGYLSRRSGGFRTSLRAQQRRARERGASFRRTLARTTDEVNDLLRACHGVEVRTWKAAEGMGVDQGAARTFQHGVMRRAADLGLEARAVVMELDGADVAYVNGVVGPEGYRGMSLSFDESFRPLGAGNLVQAEMLAWLCDDAVRWYDLGGTLPYKERWGEIGLSTTGWVVLNDKG
jgi:CelD/BcsL family acetyltransferase involved in cellulose biosynthesis